MSDTPPDEKPTPTRLDEATDPPTDEATFDSFREAVAWVHAHVRQGTIWVGWAADGRFAFGDRDHMPGDDVELVDPAEFPIEAAALAGAAAQNIVNRAIAQQREARSRLAVPNRAARRAAERGGTAGRPGNGLILPGR